MRVSWVVFALLILYSSGAVAQTACGVGNSGATYLQVHTGANNQIIWCADPTFWRQNSASVTPFFAYYDALLPVITQDFGIAAQGPFFIAVDPPNGGASTPTPFGQGVNISGDSFSNTAYNVPGFWGYLLGTHEFVNQWTGLVNGGGWPNDWWADHRSPFPNSLDPILLAQMGQAAVAQAQYNRFVPGGDSADPEVVMFTDLFNAYGQWPYYRSTFALLRADGMAWNNLRDPPSYTTQTPFVSGNPSALLSDYIIAYFSLAAGVDTSSRFGQSVGIGLQPPNWPAGQTYISYSINSNEVGSIADAHCALAAAQAFATNAGPEAQSAMAQFQKGDYNTALSAVSASAACGAACPAECGCDPATQRCVAKWHSDAAGSPSGTSAGGGAGITGADSGSMGAGPAPVAMDTPSNTTGSCNATDVQTWCIAAATGGLLAWVRRRRARGHGA